MGAYLWLAVLLIASPFAICAVQAMAFRLLKACGFSHVPPQMVALITIAFGNVPVAWLSWVIAFEKSSSGELGVFCGICYVLLTYNALAFCYLNFLNASETSLHVHILMTLLLEGSIPFDDLTKRYGAREMIGARIERMIAFGQIKEVDGFFVLTGRAHLVTVGKLINQWRRVLRLPLSPE